MQQQSRKTFLPVLVSLVLFTLPVFAGSHKSLNGTWTLIPTRSDFAGQPAIETGTVTINDREHNISISRNFSYDGENQSFAYSFSTDGRENSTVHNGKTFKSKAKWDSDVLKVTTTQDNAVVTEEYALQPDGMMQLVVDRPGHNAVTLFFERR